MDTLNRRTWLKELRKERGLTCREIAKQLEMSFSHYSDIENGRRNPSIDLSVKMAKFLQIPVDKFLQDRVKFSEKNIG